MKRGYLFQLSAAAIILAGCASTSAVDDAVVERISNDANQITSSGTVTASGSFVGKSNHITTGDAKVVRAGGQWFVVLDDKFTLDGAPDPKVAFGDASGWDAASSMGKLLLLSGEQAYKVPDGIDVGDYRHIYIWCEQFNVPLGVAELEL